MPNTSAAPTMGPMPETIGSRIADFRNAEASGIIGTLAKGVVDSGLDAANYLRNINPFSDQRDYDGLYPRFTDWDGMPLGGEEGLNRKFNGILFFGSFLTGPVSIEVNAVKSTSPKVQKVLDMINDFKAKGGKVDPVKLQEGQELNLIFSTGTKRQINLRIETHEVPTKFGGNGVTPQRHMNVDLLPNKKILPNAGHEILE